MLSVVESLWKPSERYSEKQHCIAVYWPDNKVPVGKKGFAVDNHGFVNFLRIIYGRSKDLAQTHLGDIQERHVSAYLLQNDSVLYITPTQEVLRSRKVLPVALVDAERKETLPTMAQFFGLPAPENPKQIYQLKGFEVLHGLENIWA